VRDEATRQTDGFADTGWCSGRRLTIRKDRALPLADRGGKVMEMTELEEFRKQKDAFFAKHRNSPLTAGQRKDFKGLQYFPENPDLRLEVEVEELPEKHTIEFHARSRLD
jgi:uncharacterized protein (DUF1684 family)